MNIITVARQDENKLRGTYRIDNLNSQKKTI